MVLKARYSWCSEPLCCGPPLHPILCRTQLAWDTQELFPSLSLSNWKKLHKVEGWCLSEIRLLPAALSVFYPLPSNSKTSCSFVKLIVMKVARVSILDAFAVSPNKPVFTEIAYECCICWSQWDLCCYADLNWWIFWSSEKADVSVPALASDLKLMMLMSHTYSENCWGFSF